MKFGLGAGLYDIPRQWVELKNKRYIPDPTKVKLRRAYAQWTETGEWALGAGKRASRSTSTPKSPAPPNGNGNGRSESLTLSFGKYQGKTLQQVLQEDPDYLKMLADKAGDMTLDFGKYEGKTLQQILQEDPDYITYLADKAYDDKVRQAAASLSLVQAA